MVSEGQGVDPKPSGSSVFVEVDDRGQQEVHVDAMQHALHQLRTYSQIIAKEIIGTISAKAPRWSRRRCSETIEALRFSRPSVFLGSIRESSPPRMT